MPYRIREAAAVVRRIFQSVLAGETIASIAKELRAEKIPIPSEHWKRAGEPVRAAKYADPYAWSATTILVVIQRVSWYVRHNEKEFTERVREGSDQNQEKTVKECKQKISKAQKRHKELDGLVKKLYEGNATGKIPDKHFTRLLAEYDEEQTGLETSIAEWQRQIENWNADKLKTDQFIQLVKRYTDFSELTTPICETTLYNWIYRGDVFLNVTEADLLYKGNRRNEGRKAGDNHRARSAKGDTIEQRPEEINSRETIGNWEMDSVMGCKGSKAALVVLTERLTRYPVIIRVPDHTMESVVRALDRMERRMGAKFREVFRSITVDNGCEFQDCEGMERSKRARKPRTKIFYCHPYSAYERGSNENMNRIIRRFFPKGTNFDNVSAAEVAEVAEWLANYPRRILGWKTPQTLYDEYMTVAA